MTTLQERIEELMAAKGWTVGEMARIAGVSSSAASQWKGGRANSLKIGPATNLALASGYSAVWISTGEGPKRPHPRMNDLELVDGSKGKIPLISWVTAGNWCDSASQLSADDAERWLDCPVPYSSCTFALRVRGDSMTAPGGNSRTYPEGSIIFVDPEKRSPVNGDRVVACLENSHDVTFKVYKNEDGRQWLQPLNPSHEPIRQPFKIIGTVLGKWEDG